MTHDLDEALQSTFETVGHALRIAAEARSTNDDEDENGEPLDPIHRYSESLIKKAMPLAVMGLFILAARDEELVRDNT